MGNRNVLWAIEVLLLAPVLVAVICGALLLLGVPPRLVFLPGHWTMAMFATLGIHVSNRVGVVATGVAWWAVIVAARVGLAQWTRHAARGRKGTDNAHNGTND